MNSAETLKAPRALRSLLAASTAITLAFPLAAQENCALVNGQMPPGCDRPEAGTVVVMPVGPNTANDAVAEEELGPLGFAITVEEAPPAAAAGDGATTARADDRKLEAAGVQVTFDGLGIRQRLAVSTEDMRSTYTAGQPVTFRASSNYPAFVERAEVRVIDPEHPTKPLAVLPVQPNGTVDWAMPAEGAEEMIFALRVYDARGRYDETYGVPLNRSAKEFDAEPKNGRVIAAGEGEDMTARRVIPIRGGAVTVTGTTGGGDALVMGETVPADASGRYVVQRILPPGRHLVTVGTGASRLTRSITVPKREVFYTGLADLTFGKERGGESYNLGRLAGYATGHTARGYTITGSLDTREGELEDLFSDLNAKNPDRVLRRIEPDDVYPTFGDDSTSFDDAPTSGKFYLKVERDTSHLLWGDFKLAEEDSGSGTGLIRSDRTLYGLQIVHDSVAQTSHGAPRLRFSAYAAEPDRLVQRDTLRGTGGSAYFLKRQDILSGTETILVQLRDPVSGRVVSSRVLVAGEDYEIDYFQGIVLLTRPLGSSAGGGGPILGRPLGDYDVNLVAQYEYVPTSGSVDGLSVGARAEGWVTDNVRLGATAQRDTTGIADNSIQGADILLRRSDATYLSFEYARSEGPGFGSDFSLTGGLDLDPATGLPSTGVIGLPADAIKVEASADLAELTGGRMAGEITAHYDRKEKGFVSADYDVAETQTEWGVDGRIVVATNTELTFEAEDFKTDTGRRQTDATIGIAQRLNDRLLAEFAVAHTKREEPLGTVDQNGSRTDAGARLTWERDEDTSAWIFAQTTLHRIGLRPNHRIGVGAAFRLTEKLSAAAEVSGGSLGGAGEAKLTYDSGVGREAHVGYRLDPTRSNDTAGFTGSDGGTWVVGGTAKVNDALSYNAENTYDLAGNSKALTTAYGVRYTPSDVWSYDGALEFGTTDNRLGGSFTRKAISLGTTYAPDELTSAGVKFEYRIDDGTDILQDRKTWLVTGFARYQMSDDWRFLANVDALVSKSDQSSFRDGRYVEANLGFAYRPVAHDRLNILARYTYLNDQPGVDQVNVDGDIEGPAQKSHILSFDVNYDLNPYWTLGGKLGYRKGEIAARGTDDFVPASAGLAVVRLDYHVVHNWDLMLEGRVLNDNEADMRETGLLAGVYRHFGNNLKVGVGYQWGDVSDDLRLIDGRKEGAFLNIVGKF